MMMGMGDHLENERESTDFSDPSDTRIEKTFTFSTAQLMIRNQQSYMTLRLSNPTLLAMAALHVPHGPALCTPAGLALVSMAGCGSLVFVRKLTMSNA
jgi:hypothetical protein